MKEDPTRGLFSTLGDEKLQQMKRVAVYQMKKLV